MPARTRDTGRAGSSNQSASSSRTGHFGRSSNGRRPRSRVQEEEEEPPARRRRVGESSNGRRRTEETPNEEEEGEDEEEAEGEGEGGDDDGSDGEANVTGLREREKLPISDAIRNMVQAMDKEGKDGIKRKANDLARLALFSELRRTPLRRSDISVKVFNKENSKNLFPVVFNQAQKVLRSSFGYEMVELRARGTDNEQIMLAQTQAQTQRRRDPEKEDEKDPKVKGVLSKSYVLVSVLPSKLISRITQPSATLGSVPDYTVGGNRGNISGTEGVLLDWKRSNADLGKTGLTMLILALVLVNNRVMPEDQLRSYLRRMGLKGVLPESLQSHPELASGGLVGRDSDGIMLDDFLASLVKQDYLERTKVQTAAAATNAASMDASMARRRTQARGNVKRTRNGDSDVVEDFELRWGSRAEAEIGETAAASFIADICMRNNNSADVEGEEEEEQEQEAETQNGLGSSRERQKKRREQILREVQRAAGSTLVV